MVVEISGRVFVHIFVGRTTCTDGLLRHKSLALIVTRKHFRMTDKELKHSIGRLIMPRLNVDEFVSIQKYRNEIEHQVRVGKAAGFCIFGGTPQTVVDTTGHLQEIAKEYYQLPLLFSCDAEWGVTMRLREGGTEFPHARAFAKAKDATLIEEASYRIAMELRALGIWWHFAPVADVNTNPSNPIINVRAYGETAESVTKNATTVFHGIRRAGIIACAKHFPGHGNTVADSHQELPILTELASWIKTNDIPPFKALIEEGIPSIMTGHIAAPELAARYGAVGRDMELPATISKALTKELLRTQMRFDGVIVTDSLEMGGIRKVVNKPGELACRVLGAGADVLLMPTDTIETHQAIWRGLDMGTLDRDEIEASVSRVHKLVEFSMAGDTPTLEETFNRGRTRSLALKIAEKALKIKGEIASLMDATEIVIVCSDRKPDLAKAEAAKATWESLGITLPVTIIHDTAGMKEFSDSPIVITYDRPHGVLGKAVHQNAIEDVLNKVIRELQNADIDVCCGILLGNPYLEGYFEPLGVPCTILTYSATEPSITAIGNIIKNDS